MGKIEIDVPQGMQAAFDEAFPGGDASKAVWKVIEREIERRRQAADDDREPSGTLRGGAHARPGDATARAFRIGQRDP